MMPMFFADAHQENASRVPEVSQVVEKPSVGEQGIFCTFGLAQQFNEQTLALMARNGMTLNSYKEARQKIILRQPEDHQITPEWAIDMLSELTHSQVSVVLTLMKQEGILSAPDQDNDNKIRLSVYPRP